MAKVKITETVLRDSHQSLAATRMTTEELLPALELLDAVGYHSLEAWGCATFDSCLRYLNEDPWERLRAIRSRVKNTKLQMLFRGQNILGYRHYSDDVVEYFVKKSIANGIDIDDVFRRHDKGTFFYGATPEEARRQYTAAFIEDVQSAGYTEEIERGILQLCEDVASGRLEMRKLPARCAASWKVSVRRPVGSTRVSNTAECTGTRPMLAKARAASAVRR